MEDDELLLFVMRAYYYSFGKDQVAETARVTFLYSATRADSGVSQGHERHLWTLLLCFSFCW